MKFLLALLAIFVLAVAFFGLQASDQVSTTSVDNIDIPVEGIEIVAEVSDTCTIDLGITTINICEE